ncbi:MAG: hypothetical protein IJP22_00550 [Clostridia bacterium]|nr:hypothetical protein [Clostridia bacterium]
MKLIFSGEVYEVLPIMNGIIFSYKKEEISDQTIVGYKMISFSSGQFTDVERNIYRLTKFGNNYTEVIKHIGNYIEVKSLLLAGGKIFLIFPDGKATLLDLDATPVWSGNLLYKGEAPSDVKFHGNALWATYEEKNVLIRFNLNTMRNDLRLGNRKEPFSAPKDIFIEEDRAIVSNYGSKKLIAVNLNDYTVEDLEEFEEGVKQYICIDEKRMVILESGLYLL